MQTMAGQLARGPSASNTHLDGRGVLGQHREVHAAVAQLRPGLVPAGLENAGAARGQAGVGRAWPGAAKAQRDGLAPAMGTWRSSTQGCGAIADSLPP